MKSVIDATASSPAATLAASASRPSRDIVCCRRDTVLEEWIQDLQASQTAAETFRVGETRANFTRSGGWGRRRPAPSESDEVVGPFQFKARCRHHARNITQNVHAVSCGASFRAVRLHVYWLLRLIIPSQPLQPCFEHSVILRPLRPSTGCVSLHAREPPPCFRQLWIMWFLPSELCFPTHASQTEKPD